MHNDNWDKYLFWTQFIEYMDWVDGFGNNPWDWKVVVQEDNLKFKGDYFHEEVGKAQCNAFIYDVEDESDEQEKWLGSYHNIEEWRWIHDTSKRSRLDMMRCGEKRESRRYGELVVDTLMNKIYKACGNDLPIRKEVRNLLFMWEGVNDSPWIGTFICSPLPSGFWSQSLFWLL